MANKFALTTRNLWRFRLPRMPIIAGTAERSVDLEGLRDRLSDARGLVWAQQVHGASIAAVGHPAPISPIPGCDALLTHVSRLALVIRTADCLPVFVWDMAQRVVGLAHVGWRGLVARLPMRLVSALQQCYHSRPQDLWIGIGPAIRACCYDVGPEFEARFGRFVRRRGGKRFCDLIGATVQQLIDVGVARARIADSGLCTACDSQRWYSVRREPGTPGRLLSFVMLAPRGG